MGATTLKALEALHKLGYELDGVIADVEQGSGFDAVCLETIKRVRAALAASAGEGEADLPVWWNDFITNVCELPDRTSPEDEPDAMVATERELENCALNAIEQHLPTPSVHQDEAVALDHKAWKDEAARLSRDWATYRDFTPSQETAWQAFCAHLDNARMHWRAHAHLAATPQPPEPAISVYQPTEGEAEPYRWNEPGIQTVHAMLCCHGGEDQTKLACRIVDALAARFGPLTTPPPMGGEPAAAPGLALESGEFIPAAEIAHRPG